MIRLTLTKRRGLLLGLAILLAAASIVSGALIFDRRAVAPRSSHAAAVVAPIQAPASFDTSRYSTTDPSSLWVVVNKQHPLSPIDYTPADLTPVSGKMVSTRLVGDLNVMVADAASAGASLTLVSTYRPYSYQVNLYNSYVARDGRQQADTYSARPGYSEHQTGLAIDFGNRAGTCTIEPCFGGTTEGRWLATNAYKYGFLLRYTPEKRIVTGYDAEAWHYRYVGRGLTAEMHARNVQTLEEFFGISGGESYN